jgi:predicted RNase H-like nuclease
MCYWAVLDAFYRQKQAEQLYVSKELKNYTWLTAYDLHDFQTFKKCGEVCSLIISDEDKAKKAHEQLTQQKFNVNPDRETKEIEDIATQEALVLDRVAYFDVLFTERVLESKYLEDDVKKIFA